MAVVEQMAGGDLTVRTGVTRSDGELGELGYAFDRMPIACILWDLDHRVTLWNASAEKIFGFSEGEMLGKQAFDLIVPEALRLRADAFWLQLMGHNGMVGSVNENQTKDGRSITCEWFNTLLEGLDGSVVGVLSMVQDVTEREMAETAIQTLVESSVAITGSEYFDGIVRNLCAWLRVESAFVGEMVAECSM